MIACANDGTVTGSEAADILYDLVGEGMNLHPKVYAKLQRELEGIDDRPEG